MTREEERRIVERVRGGDVNAFEALVTAHSNMVYKLAYRMLGNEDDAQDMAQEAFIRAFNSLDNFRGDSKFSVWLHRLTSNICIDFLRARTRRPSSSLTVQSSDSEEVGELEISDTRYSPEEVLDKREMQDALARGLESLSDDFREILTLREVQGMSYDEISALLNIETGTVKSRIFRARKKLCEFLLNDGNIPDTLTSKFVEKV